MRGNLYCTRGGQNKVQEEAVGAGLQANGIIVNYPCVQDSASAQGALVGGNLVGRRVTLYLETKLNLVPQNYGMAVYYLKGTTSKLLVYYSNECIV